ncbi:unnamed protein product, partial [Closterium sp. Naga37s-1]
MPLERLTDAGRHDARVDQSSSAEQTSDDACMGSGGKEEYDALVVGAGIAGCALAYSLGKTGRRVLVLERDLSEPDRIVGELLQPGGYLKLVELGMQDCVDGIDAQRVDGYALFMDGGDCKGVVPDALHGAAAHALRGPPPRLGGQRGGRGDVEGGGAGLSTTAGIDALAGRTMEQDAYFSPDLLFSRISSAASIRPALRCDARRVTLREATVLGLLEDGDRVTGVRYRSAKRASGSAQGEVREASAVGGKGETEEGEMLAPLTFVCDGCFSNLRRSISKSKVRPPPPLAPRHKSHFTPTRFLPQFPANPNSPPNASDPPIPAAKCSPRLPSSALPASPSSPAGGRAVVVRGAAAARLPLAAPQLRARGAGGPVARALLPRQQHGGALPRRHPRRTKVPSIASGDMADYLLSAVLPQVRPYCPSPRLPFSPLLRALLSHSSAIWRLCYRSSYKGHSERRCGRVTSAACPIASCQLSRHPPRRAAHGRRIQHAAPAH